MGMGRGNNDVLRVEERRSLPDDLHLVVKQADEIEACDSYRRAAITNHNGSHPDIIMNSRRPAINFKPSQELAGLGGCDNPFRGANTT